jgi:hypothetical protein
LLPSAEAMIGRRDWHTNAIYLRMYCNLESSKNCNFYGITSMIKFLKNKFNVPAKIFRHYYVSVTKCHNSYWRSCYSPNTHQKPSWGIRKMHRCKLGR